MNKFVKQICILAVCVLFIGFGASLTMKAALGIGAYDAAAMSLSKALFIKVGSIAMCINIICILLQLIVLKKDFKPMQFLQVGVAVLAGLAINFFLYNVFGGIIITNYVLRLILLVTGYTICASTASVIMAVNIVSLPLEGLCLALANRIKMDFGKARQYADIASICVVVILTLVFRTELTLREGTIIGMVIYGPMLGRFMNIFKPMLAKYDLIVSDEENNNSEEKVVKTIKV